jgi:outer membrane lipoprotein SlyB
MLKNSSGKAMRLSVAVLACFFLITGCSGQTGKRAGEGAGFGAMAGAVGGVVSALVFGGNVGDAAAMGAVWGASTGAVSGAIAGSQEDKVISAREQVQRQEAQERLKTRIGEDAFAGLVALVQCKHTVAISYAEIARNSGDKQFALAGEWLEVLSYADGGEMDKARTMLSGIMTLDAAIEDEAEAIRSMRKALAGVVNIRKDHGLQQQCTQ